MGKVKLGPCTVIFYLMIFSYDLVHIRDINKILALQPMKRACLLELIWVQHFFSTPVSSWYPAQCFSMVLCLAHCQDTAGRLAANIHASPPAQLSTPPPVGNLTYSLDLRTINSSA